MVVGPKPAVKGCGAFSAGAVDRAVGPAPGERADEALGFAVGAWPVGPRAEVTQAEQLAGERVDGGTVGRAVVGHDALDGDAVTGVEGDCALEKRDRGDGLLIGQDFDVSQARRVIDADVDELPALGFSAPARPPVGVLARTLARDAMPNAGDLAELFDVDVDELPRPRALV